MILDQLTLLLDIESSLIKVSRNTAVDYRLPKYFGIFGQNMVIKNFTLSLATRRNFN